MIYRSFLRALTLSQDVTKYIRSSCMDANKSIFVPSYICSREFSRKVNKNKISNKKLKYDKEREKIRQKMSARKASGEVEGRNTAVGEFVPQAASPLLTTYVPRKISFPPISNSLLSSNFPVGAPFQISRILAENIKKRKVLPSYNKNLFAVLMNPVLILRESFIEFVKNVEKTNDPIIVSGKSGSGKSGMLFSLVSFLLDSNHVVLYIPDITEYVIGKIAYDRDDSGYYFIQPLVVKDILSNFLELNQDKLKDIAGSGTDVYTLCEKAVESPSESTECFKKVLDLLKNYTGNKFNVYIVIDQMNHIFGKTKYNDENSRPIFGYEFLHFKYLVPFLFGKSSLESGCVVSSMDFANSYSNKTPLALALCNLECVSKYNPYSTELSVVDRAVQKANPALNDGPIFLKHNVMHAEVQSLEIDQILYENKARTFYVNPFSYDEVNHLIDMYQKMDLIKSPKDDENFAHRNLFTSGGNGHELFSFITQMQYI